MEKFAAIFKWCFGCHHSQLSRVFTISGRTYRVCCNCSVQFDYSLESMSVKRGLRRPMASLYPASSQE